MSNSKIIYDTYIGSQIFGVISAEDRMNRRVVFVDDIVNILGFRRYLPTIEYEGVMFYEVGGFADKLYYGDVEAHLLLNMPNEFVEKVTTEMMAFKDKSKKLISQQVVKSLMDSVDNKYKEIESKKSFFSDEKSIKKLGYDKEIAYICNLYLRLAKDILIREEFIVQREDAQLLQAIKDGRFSKETLVKEIDAQIDEVNKLWKKTKLPLFPSKNLLNEILLEIRKIDEILRKV